MVNNPRKIIIENDPKKIKAMKDQSIDQLERIQLFYSTNLRLIGLFTILYISLVIQRFSSGAPIVSNIETYSIRLLDILITTVIGFQMSYFVSIARKRYFAKKFVPLDEFSNKIYLRQHTVYLTIIIMKFLPDIYFFNTDGSFWITNIFLILFLSVMWAIEYYFDMTEDALMEE